MITGSKSVYSKTMCLQKPVEFKGGSTILKLANKPAFDNFNGKIAQSTQKSIIEQTIEFLGKKKNRNSDSSTGEVFEIAPDFWAPGGSNIMLVPGGFPEMEIKPGPYGTSTNYRNLFPHTQLKAAPNPNLRRELSSDVTIYSATSAEKRISSLSRYLKEDMVGFVTPAGYHWFPKALENIIHGARAKRVPSSEYKDVAKEFWSLLAKADSYWTSNSFMNYLESMDPTRAVVATIEAIKEIQLERQGVESKLSFGALSYLKDIQKLLDDGCAYTAVPMVRRGPPSAKVSLEHIFPRSMGGEDDDLNYFLATAQSNSDRGNMPLIQYLKGRSQRDWKS